MTDGMTTAEWQELPLTTDDVTFFEEALRALHGFSSSFPWPTAEKILRVARENAVEPVCLACGQTVPTDTPPRDGEYRSGPQVRIEVDTDDPDAIDSIVDAVRGGIDAFMDAIGGDEIIRIGKPGPLNIMDMLALKGWFDQRMKDLRKAAKDAGG